MARSKVYRQKKYHPARESLPERPRKRARMHDQRDSLDLAQEGNLGAQPARTMHSMIETGWKPTIARWPRFDDEAKALRFDSLLNDEQADVWKLMNDCRLVWLLGVAGTGKSHVAVCRALHELICAGSVRRIVALRPAVESGERLGYLPGTFQAKIDPYFQPIYDILDQMIGHASKTRVQVKRCLEVTPIAYLRGRSFRNTFVIVDEAQNCDLNQLKLVTTRLGKGSRMVITGDPKQSDLNSSGFAKIAGDFARSNMVRQRRAAVFTCTQMMRDPLVEEILQVFGDLPCPNKHSGTS